MNLNSLDAGTIALLDGMSNIERRQIFGPVDGTRPNPRLKTPQFPLRDAARFSGLKDIRVGDWMFRGHMRFDADSKRHSPSTHRRFSINDVIKLALVRKLIPFTDSAVAGKIADAILLRMPREPLLCMHIWFDELSNSWKWKFNVLTNGWHPAPAYLQFDPLNTIVDTLQAMGESLAILTVAK